MNKPLVPMTRRQMVMIANNIRKVVSTANIELLTKQSYNFLYLSSGFIAHYNLYGFRANYENTTEFANAILNKQSMNQWSNFRPGERDYEYNMAKKECYNMICDELINLGFSKRTAPSWAW